MMPDEPDPERSVRHAAGVLVCPRCGIPLRGRDHKLGIAWHWEKGSVCIN